MTTVTVAPTAQAPESGKPGGFGAQGLALLTNTALNGVLGIAFWLLAGRTASVSDVALAIAGSSLIILLSFLTQLNLGTALSRFLGGAHGASRSLVRYSYIVTMVASALVVGVLVAIAAAEHGALLRDADWTFTLVLAASVPLWTAFALQDNVLVAIRRAPLIPIENTAAAILRLALLPLLADHGATGLLLAFVLPAVPAVLVVSGLFVRRLPARSPIPAADVEAGTALSPRRMLHFALLDLPGVLAAAAALRIVPVLVLQWRGTEPAAFIGLPWTTLTVALLALSAISLALLAELATPGADPRKIVARTNKLLLGLIPLCLIGAALVDPLLSLAGPKYAADGTPVLIGGILALVPAAATEVRIAQLRFAHRVGAAAAVQFLRAVPLVALAAVLAATDRLEWIGAALILVNVLSWFGAGRLLRPAPVPAAVAEPLPIAPGRRFSLPWPRIAGAAGIALAAVGLARADLSRINGLGLLPVPSAAYWIGVALVLVWAVAEIARPTPRAAFWFGAALFTVVFLVHGLPGIVEPDPRFAVAYIHSGFAGQIATNGALLPLLDARFSWPSMFAGAALVQQGSGGGAVLWLIRFCPVVITLIACAATMTLGRTVGLSATRVRAAALMFALLTWVGQDYFAPQAIGYVLYLAIVCTVLLVFPAGGPKPGGRLHRWLRPRDIPRATFTMRTQRSVLVAVVLTIGVLVTCHQLTPGFLALALIALAVVNATRLRALGLVVVAMTIGWLSYAAEAYWIGHTSVIFGSAGKVGSLVQQNVGKRTGGNGERSIVVASRLGLSAVLFLALAVAIVLLWRRRSLPLPLVALAMAPFPLLVAAAYGGEMLLRVFFFVLPAATLLIAEGFGGIRWAALRRWAPTRQVICSALAIALLPALILARFGNESFEQVAPQDLAVLSTAYRVAPNGSTVYVLNSITVEYTERLDQVRFRSFKPAQTASEIVAGLKADTDRRGRPLRDQYVMVNHSQEAEGVALQGLSPGWSAETVGDLLATGDFTLVTRQDDAVLLKFDRPAKGGR